MLYSEIGLLLLPFAFAISFYGLLSIDRPLRLDAILSANPQFYVSYVWNVFLFLIFPLVIGLTFIIVGYKKERMLSNGTFSQLSLGVIGAVFTVYGVFQLLWDYRSYYEAINIAHNLSHLGIIGLFLTIYATASIAGTLWLFTGLLVVYSPLHNSWRKVRATVSSRVTLA